ncbi:MAG TPA: nucleotide exchange factor GrpE [Candidatus Paceibacterota bacterium]
MTNEDTQKDDLDTADSDEMVLKKEIDDESEDFEYSDENLQDTVKKLREKLKEANKEKMEYLTGWQKDKAEFVNARRRDDEAKMEFLKFSKQGVIEEILPVIDSFDLAMGNKEGWESVSKEWRTGVENIYNQFLNILSKHGVVAFGAVGDPFDTALHHSIGSTKTENKDDDHKLAEILQRGYQMSGRTIRPALVKVWEIQEVP